jgi:hypothetical protein
MKFLLIDGNVLLLFVLTIYNQVVRDVEYSLSFLMKELIVRLTSRENPFLSFESESGSEVNGIVLL